MPKDQEPNRSLSHKLRQLGRLNLKSRPRSVGDKGRHSQQSPSANGISSDADFQITHTPDRLVSPRPVPSVEECREQIRRWHHAAEKKRMHGEQADGDEDDVEFSLTPTIERDVSTRESRRLAGEWAIQSSSRKAAASPKVAVGEGDKWEKGDMARVLKMLSADFSLRASEDGEGDKKDVGGGWKRMYEPDYSDFPVFHPAPGQIPRVSRVPRPPMKEPPLNINKLPKGGFLSPEETEKAYATAVRTSPEKDKRKSPLANQVQPNFDWYSSDENDDDSISAANQRPDDVPHGTEIPSTFNELLYSRGLCPSCLHPRSEASALRCERCTADLSQYNPPTHPSPLSSRRSSASSSYHEPAPKPTTSPPKPTKPPPPAPQPSRPHPTPSPQPFNSTRSPPPALRERRLLSQLQPQPQPRPHSREMVARNRASPTPDPRPNAKQHSSLRSMTVSPPRDYTYIPLVESERKPLRSGLSERSLSGGGQELGGRGAGSRLGSRGRRMGGDWAGLGGSDWEGESAKDDERGKEVDPRYLEEGEDADLYASIYEDYDDGKLSKHGAESVRYTFGGQM